MIIFLINLLGYNKLAPWIGYTFLFYIFINIAFGYRALSELANYTYSFVKYTCDSWSPGPSSGRLLLNYRPGSKSSFLFTTKSVIYFWEESAPPSLPLRTTTTAATTTAAAITKRALGRCNHSVYFNTNVMLLFWFIEFVLPKNITIITKSGKMVCVFELLNCIMIHCILWSIKPENLAHNNSLGLFMS